MKFVRKAINYIKYLWRNNDGVALQSSIMALMNYNVIKHYKKHYWIPQYGEFDERNDYEQYMVKVENSECGSISGEVIKWTEETGKDKILLAGDGNSAKEALSGLFKEITTASISRDSDYYWDFEKDYPTNIGKHDVIISQAMFEHLIHPYKHIEDMAKLLNDDGYIIIQTHTQFHGYHRYPVDTLRYQPDWFEECAKRLNLKVVKRRIKRTNIWYMFQKKKRGEK